MTDYRPITSTEFAGLRWSRYADYGFAAADTVAPLVFEEITKACLSLPIAFELAEEGFRPVLVQGLIPGKNMVVSDGKWLAPYVPAVYRGYPFALLPLGENELALCIDMDSGLVSEAGALPFFDENRRAADDVVAILHFLKKVRDNRALTGSLCAILAEEDLIQPWEVAVRTGEAEQSVGGLFRIDETRLQRLSAAAIAKVHAAGGALPLAYCQLLSMGNIQTLGLIARKLEEKRFSAPDARTEVNLDGFFRQNADDLRVRGPGDPAESVIDLSFDDGDIDLTRLSRN